MAKKKKYIKLLRRLLFLTSTLSLGYTTPTVADVQGFRSRKSGRQTLAGTRIAKMLMLASSGPVWIKATVTKTVSVPLLFDVTILIIFLIKSGRLLNILSNRSQISTASTKQMEAMKRSVDAGGNTASVWCLAIKHKTPIKGSLVFAGGPEAQRKVAKGLVSADYAMW